MAKPKLTFTVYKAKDGFRWRAVHRNGNITAESGEAYKRKSGAAKAVDSLISTLEWGEFEVEKARGVSE